MISLIDEFNRNQVNPKNRENHGSDAFHFLTPDSCLLTPLVNSVIPAKAGIQFQRLPVPCN
jgi:hypothetical protein